MEEGATAVVPNTGDRIPASSFQLSGIEVYVAGKPPRNAASLRSSAKKTSTVSPGCNFLTINCSYARDESAANAVRNACLILLKSFLSANGSC